MSEHVPTPDELAAMETEESRELAAYLGFPHEDEPRVGEHNSCGTPDCCGTCPTAGSVLNVPDPAKVDADFERRLNERLDALEKCDPDDEAETVDTHVPAGAAAMWDHIAGTSPQYIPPWEDQSEHSRNVFIRAFSIGLETLAHAAADA